MSAFGSLCRDWTKMIFYRLPLLSLFISSNERYILKRAAILKISSKIGLAWPEHRNFDAMTACTALEILDDSKIRNGALPPISKVTLLMWAAALVYSFYKHVSIVVKCTLWNDSRCYQLKTTFPTCDDPVNPIWRTKGWLQNRFPTVSASSRDAVTTLNRRPSRPAFSVAR